jgi:hypothetical protein
LKRTRFRRADIWAAFAGLLLVAYAGIRAARLPITIDEAVTYRFFVTAPASEILFPDLANPKSIAETRGVAANNHPLNSILAKGSTSIFGPSGLAVRLPNVLSLAAYLVFSWLILRSLRSGWACLAGFLLLALNPFLLDYFSMARGYGLSVGLMTAGLYWIRLSITSPSPRNEAIGLFLLGLGALASYVLIDLLLAAAIGMTIFRGIRIFSSPDPTGRSRFHRFAVESVPLMVIGLLLLASIGLNVLALESIRGLWYGGRVGFWHDTVSSLVEATLYTAPYSAAARSILSASVAAVAALVSIRAILSLGKRPIARADAEAAGWTFFLLVTVAIGIVEHEFFGAPLREGRVALYFIPLFVIAVATTAEAIALSMPRYQRVISYSMGALAFAAVVHFAICCNFSRFLYFIYDMDTKRLLADLESKKTSFHHPIRVHTEWKIAPGIEFYRSTRRLWWITWDTQASDWRNFDYAYVYPESSQELAAHEFQIVRTYPRSGNLLAVPRSALPLP